MGACESRAQNSLGSKLNSASESLKIAKFYVNLDELKSSMAGEIITPENKDLYMKARERAFNQDHRGYPILIIRPANSHDVSFCIKFVNKYAKDEILCVASGCHSSRCMLDGAIVIDLVNLSEVKVNETSMTVDAGGGCYLKDVDSALMPFNYGTTVGTYPETGIGGLATAGGFGWLGRKFGLTCDNIIEVEVVLANGEIVVANNENEYADLIWGIRGGGGNFGIVTKFVLKIHQLPPYCIGGTLVNLAPTIASAIEVYVKFDQMVQTMPVDMSSAIVFPAGAPVVPQVWTYFGDKNAVKDVPLLKDTKHMGGWLTLENKLKPMSYHKDLQTLTVPLTNKGNIYLSDFLVGSIDKTLPVQFIQELLEYTRKSLPSTLKSAMVLFGTMGGQYQLADTNNQTCVSTAARNARYFVLIDCYWKDSAGDKGRADAKNWVNGAKKKLAAEKTAAPLRYTSGNLDDDGEVTSVVDDVELRLKSLKAKYDPHVLFKQTIPIRAN